MAVLGEIAEWGSGGTPKRGVAGYFGHGVPWLSIADLNDGVVTQAKESSTDSGIANSSAKNVPAGTIFVAMYGSIGKLGIAGREMCTSQAIAFAKPCTDLVEPRYLFQYLLAQRSALRAHGRGGTQMNIGQGDLKKWPILLPSLGEQHRVAAILDHADALRAKRRQVLAHFDTLTQSVFQKMFDKSAAVVPFGEVIMGGPTNGLYRPSADYGYGTPILRIDGFDNGIVKAQAWKRVCISPTERDRYSLRTDDIIINRVNALSHLGKSALIEDLNEPSVFESNMMRIRLDLKKVVPQFVIAWLQSNSARRQVLASAKKAINQASINQGDVRSLLMPIPPHDLQLTFASRIEAVNSHRFRVLAAQAAGDTLFSSLQSSAFRGEL